MTMNWSSDITWMRGLLILAVTLFTAAGALAGEAGGPSAIQLVSGETGLGAFFTEDGTASPEDWGKNTSGGGPATVTNGVMIVGAATNNYRDFAPTLDSNQSTVGPLDGSRDWGFEVVFSQSVHVAGSRVYEAGSTLGDVARVIATGSPDEYTLDADQAGGSSYGTITTFATADDFVTLRLDYDAADTTLDFYVDGACIATNFLPRDDNPGQYGFSTVRMAGSSNGGEYHFDSIVAGPLAPLPIEATGVALGDFVGLTFASDFDNALYALEFNTVLPTSMWAETGARVRGTGGAISMFDPNGADTNKSYRVVRRSSDAPDPELDPAQPGCQVPFDSDLQAVDWGFLDGTIGAWAVSNGAAHATYMTNVAPRLLYRTSEMGSSTRTNLNTADGWIVRERFSYTETPFGMGGIEDPGGYEVQIFGPWNEGQDRWRIQLRDFSFGSMVSDVVLTQDEPHEFLFHYFREGGTGDVMNVWIDGVVAVTNFPMYYHLTKSGPMELETVQIAGGGFATGTVSVIDVVAAPVSTNVEPLDIQALSNILEAVALSYTGETGAVYGLEDAAELSTSDAFTSSSPVRVDGDGGEQKLYGTPIEGTEQFFRAVEIR